MKKKLLIGTLVLPILFGAFKVTERVTFSRDEWIADFEQLKQETERNYANLKWAAASRDVDFAALNAAASSALSKAKTPGEARSALASFIAGFEDGHFHIEAGPPKPIAAVMNLWPKSRETSVDFALNPEQACAAFGFKHKASFDGDVVTAGNRRYGLIRIPLFQHRDYAEGCERAWEVYRDGRVGGCDDACQSEFLHRAKREVAADLASAARALQRKAPHGLVIDLTGNGGGTEWAEYAAFALTSATLNAPRIAFVRGEHWARAFSEELSELPELDKPVAAAMLDSARTSCSLHGIWQGRNFQPACWNVVRKPDYPSNSYATELGQDLPYEGKLYIMIDENTASASEHFVGMLKDANAATLIGTRTMGAGCGYTNGGIDITLKNSGLKIRMPDCARIRADGSNEYDGIAADIAVTWGRDKTQDLRAALTHSVSAGASKR